MAEFSADYAVTRCLSVCPPLRPSVRPSHAGIVSKRLHISSTFFSPSVSPPFYFFSAPIKMAIFRRVPANGASNARGGGCEQITIFDQYIALSRKLCNIQPIGNRPQALAFEWYRFE